MFYEKELDFLKASLQKCNVGVFFSDPNATGGSATELIGALGQPVYFETLFQKMLPHVKPGTLYMATDPFFLTFLFLSLPEDGRLLVIGPYLGVKLTKQELLECSERCELSPEQLRLLEAFYETLTLLTPNDSLFSFLHTFCEQIWGMDYATVDINSENVGILNLLPQESGKIEYEDTAVNMRLTERRYHYEKEVMQAVSLGSYHRAASLMRSFAAIPMEQRSAHPIRNIKNYCIILNTLLRKAAEDGGVHPLRLDHQSTEFALRIETITSTGSGYRLMQDMLKAYCALVKNNSVHPYSPLIQQVIVLIDADLSAELNLRALAGQLNVNASYLSSLFKKEVGKTLTDFATERRIQAACQLLVSSKLQIQTVARYCGIPDPNYFSKLFRKYTGLTPTEFRLSTPKSWRSQTAAK